MGDIEPGAITEELDVITGDGAAFAFAQAGVFPAGIDDGADICLSRRASHWH